MYSKTKLKRVHTHKHTNTQPFFCKVRIRNSLRSKYKNFTLVNLHRYQYLIVTRPQTVLLPLQNELYPCTKYCYPWAICEQIAPLYTTLVESSDSTRAQYRFRPLHNFVIW